MNNDTKTITDALLVANNADGLYLAIFAPAGCIFLADFSGNEAEAGRIFRALKDGKMDGSDVWHDLDEGDFVADRAEEWIENGSEATSVYEDRRRVLNGWDGEEEREVAGCSALDACGGARFSLSDDVATVSHGQIEKALRAAGLIAA